MSLFLTLALLAAEPAAPFSGFVAITNPDGTSSTMPSTPSAEDERVDQAAVAIRDGKPADAMALIDAVIAEEERTHPPVQGTIYFSARSLTESLVYAALAATQKKNGIVTNGTWATTYFLKGFALIDMKRGDEARLWFDKAIALAPMNSQFLAERGEWHKTRKDWDSAYADFSSARSGAAFSDDDVRVSNEGRAIRGMAFVMVEKSKLKDAEKLLMIALKLNPNDEGARHELEYIKSLR